MKPTLNRRAWTVVITLIAVVSGTGSTMYAQSLEIYTRTDAPSNWLGSPTLDTNGWTSRGTGSSGAIPVPANGSLYFAFENTGNEDNKKSLGVEFKTTPLGAARLFINAGMVQGYNDQGTSNPATTTGGPHHASEHAGKIGVNVTIDPQPEWEMIEIVNTGGAASIEVEVAHSTCSRKQRSTGDNGVPDSQMEFTDHMFGAEGNLPNTTRITAMEVYPRNVDIDLSVAPFLDAPPPTGNWTPEFVFIDPNGDPRPHGGVRWTSDGPGLAAGEMHNLAITMTKAADSSYVFFTFDEDFGQYFNILVDLGDTPWYEDFETHYPDIGCAGWRGWQGWDDDPAFDAPVTNQQANGGANSLQIEADADAVRLFDGVDDGRWSFTAWQYIPSDFVSGGGGQNWGSFFLLLNTYNDGGPYNWSTALHADSADGMIKVFHGGNDSINVPYDTDRWVKIQIITDLDDDWTQVYYDDEFITEYSWTGGIFGGGGGLPEIQCVDLFANGATLIYYDDLALEKLEPLDDVIVPPDDWNAFRGFHVSGDLNSLLESDDDYLYFNPGIVLNPIEAPVTLDFFATLPTDSTTVEFTIESTANTVGLGITVSFWNFNTGSWDVVGTATQTNNSDTARSFAGVAADHIAAGTGEVRTRYEIRQESIVFVFPWLECVDHVYWTHD